MFDKILKDIDIKQIAFNTTKGNTYTDDLSQELIVQLLTMESNKLKELFESGNLKAYLYRMAHYSYHGSKGQFYLKYRKQLEYQEEVGRELSLEDVLDTGELTEIEKMWIKCYLDHDANYSWAGKNIDVSRQCVSKRVNEIIEKCKKLL